MNVVKKDAIRLLKKIEGELVIKGLLLSDFLVTVPLNRRTWSSWLNDKDRIPNPAKVDSIREAWERFKDETK